jgi:hypothetical protein
LTEFDDSGDMNLEDEDLIMAIYWSDILRACAIEFQPELMQPRTIEERMRVQEIIVATMQCLEHALVRLDDQMVEVRSGAELLH